jgi:two-component system chemotaxis sensor kinase CheA
MNEFLEQFLIEAKELVVQATDDLLALEARPEDQDQLESAFRAFHTLKGAAGIIEFAPMVRALHAAEDLLSRARAREVRLEAARVGDCLTALDQVDQWLATIQATGTPPHADAAEAEADAVVALFASDSAPERPDPKPGDGDWLAAILARRDQARGLPVIAIRFRPAPDCFFRGEDPLAMIARLPGLVALELTATQSWPVLALLDPFACQVEITALSIAARGDLAGALAGLSGEIEIVETAPDAGLAAAAQEILEAQIAVLAVPGGDGRQARMNSVARVAENVLRRLGRTGEAAQFDLSGSASQLDPPALTSALHVVVASLSDERGRPSRPELRAETATRSLRVDVDRIDALVRLTGELTVIKNAFGHISGLADSEGDPAMVGAALREQTALLGRLVDDLQHSVLSIRVLPMRHVFQRFPRLVRDLGASLGKPVRLVVEGEATEADKSIVEGLFEPILHVIRNALDHGLEPPSERVARGKDPQGVIRIGAARRGEHVLIEIEDDGGGIDLERVRETAARKGLAAPEALALMTPAQITDLIFTPGFSTAASLSEISGRGVGMDAVRASVVELGGRIELENRPGQGALVRLVLPFTIMMTSVMTVEAAGQVFGVALEAVIETTKVPRDQIFAIGSASAFVCRGRTVPLVGLAGLLGSSCEPPAADATVVIVCVAGQDVGLEVDGLGGRMDVMLKPMEGLLSGMNGVSGTTLLGDGRVMIVLDLAGLLS